MLLQAWLDIVERRCMAVMSKTKTTERIEMNIAINTKSPNAITMWAMLAIAAPLISAIFATDNFWIQWPCGVGAVALFLSVIRQRNSEWMTYHTHFYLNEEIMIRDHVLSSYLSAMLTELGDDNDAKKQIVDTFMKLSDAARTEIVNARNSYRTK